MISILYILTLCCVGTCVLEVLPLLFSKKKKEWVSTCLVCNIITNPILNTVVMLTSTFVEDMRLMLGIMIFLELLVVVFEAWIYWKTLREPFKKCLFVSLGLNLLSFTIGLAFFNPIRYDEMTKPKISELIR